MEFISLKASPKNIYFDPTAQQPKITSAFRFSVCGGAGCISCGTGGPRCATVTPRSHCTAASPFSSLRNFLLCSPTLRELRVEHASQAGSLTLPVSELAPPMSTLLPPGHRVAQLKVAVSTLPAVRCVSGAKFSLMGYEGTFTGSCMLPISFRSLPACDVRQDLDTGAIQ